MNNNFINDIRYAEKPTKVLEDYKIIFIYMLKDAWYQPISTVYVTNNNELHLLKDDNEKVFNINIDKLNEILEKYSIDFNKNIKIDLPFIPMLDGYHNIVYFKVNNTWYTDDISNLIGYNIDQVDNNKHLSTVLYLLDDIHTELSNQNKDIKDYFILSDED